MWDGTVDLVLDKYFLIDLPRNSLMKRFYHFTKESHGLGRLTSPESEQGPLRHCYHIPFCHPNTIAPFFLYKNRTLIRPKINIVSSMDFSLWLQFFQTKFLDPFFMYSYISGTCSFLLTGKKSLMFSYGFIDRQIVLTSITFTTSENRICLILSFRHNLMTDQYWK